MGGSEGESILINLLMKRLGCWNTFDDHNKAMKLELPRAWEPLDSSWPS